MCSRIITKNSIILILCLIVLSQQSQYVPIPKTPVGIPFGAVNGRINIQLIYDPVCYDTRDFDVNIIRVLQSTLPKQTLDQITFRLVGQAKPWHLTAHKIMQGINYVHDQKGSAEALKCFRYFLDNIPSWDNTILQTKTINQFMSSLAGQFQTLSNINGSALLPQLAHTSSYDGKARYEFKHTIGNRFSGLNPTIFVNGAKVDDGLNLSLQQWKDLINSLLK